MTESTTQLAAREALLEVQANYDTSATTDLGTKLGHLYTNHGLPLDMSLSQLQATKLDKLSILSAALAWLIEHRRLSNATEAAIDRQRKTNRQILERFWATGEVGLY